jgi:hypothetical protein
MRVALVAVVAASVLAGAGAPAPAHATDQKGFEEQARAWCGWTGPAQSDNGADRAWVLGCPSAANERVTSPAEGHRGRLLQDRARFPVGNAPKK